MTKEAYCSYEVSSLLKEKGFDEMTTYYYDDNGLMRICQAVRNSMLTNGFCSMPTHQMTMAWLREAHNIDIDIHSDCGMLGIKQYTPYIHTYTRMEPLHDEDTKVRWKQKEYFLKFADDKGLIPAHMSFDSYEEAVEEALKYVLENLNIQ